MIDWGDEARNPAESTREQLRDLDVKPHDARRVIGIRLDKRRASLRVAAPPKLHLRLRGKAPCSHERGNDDHGES